MLPEVVAALLVVGLTAYAVLGGADFGAGFWDLTAGGAKRGARVRGLVSRSMGPVWEANHVWLIFVLVVLWTGFSVAFGSIMSTLIVPLLLALLGIVLRGSAYAFRLEAGTVSQQRFFGAIFAVSSIVAPFFFGAAIGAVASGRVPVGNAAGELIGSWATPTSTLIGLLAIGTGAYLAAVYLAADAARSDSPDLVERFRLRALAAGIVVGALAIGGIFVLRSDARELYDGLTSQGLPLVITSAVAGIATLALLWTRHVGLARYVSAAAVAAVIWAWIVGQQPYFLPSELTVDEAAAPDATLVAVLVTTGIGLVILVPALLYLFRLYLGGRLDHDLVPIGEKPPERDGT